QTGYLKSLLVAVVVVVVGLVGVGRTQEVAEHPLCDVPPLLPSLYVVKAEVDTLEDSHVYNITGDVREPIVVARLHRGVGVRRMQSEAHFVAAEEERKAASCSTGDIISARGVASIPCEKIILTALWEHTHTISRSRRNARARPNKP